MNPTVIADTLWYAGHTLTAVSIFLTKDNFYAAASCVLIGQGITMISRPIGRIQIAEKAHPSTEIV